MSAKPGVLIWSSVTPTVALFRIDSPGPCRVLDRFFKNLLSAEKDFYNADWFFIVTQFGAFNNLAKEPT